MKSGIYKFKSLKEQYEFEIKERAKEGFNLKHARALLSWSIKPAYTPGVYKFKSIEEKQRDELKRMASSKKLELYTT